MKYKQNEICTYANSSQIRVNPAKCFLKNHLRNLNFPEFLSSCKCKNYYVFDDLRNHFNKMGDFLFTTRIWIF